MAQLIKDVKDLLLAAMLSELKGAAAGVQHPAQDFFMLTPSPIAFQELFPGDGFFALHYHLIWLQKGSVHCMHDTSLGILVGVPGALCDPNEAIDKNIYMDNSPQCLMSRAWSSGCGSGRRGPEIFLAVIRLMGGCGP